MNITQANEGQSPAAGEAPGGEGPGTFVSEIQPESRPDSEIPYNFHPPPVLQRPLRFPQALLWAAAALICFHLAYLSPALSFLILGYLICLIRLARLPSARQAFYFGLVVGLLSAAPQLYCFWVIFGYSAVVLWLIVAFWIGLFVALARVCFLRYGRWGSLLVPVIWIGLEYFRSELYYLRFSWLNVGYAFAESPVLPLFHWLGMYGVGFVAIAAAVVVSFLPAKRAALFGLRLALLVIVVLFLQAYFDLSNSRAVSGNAVRVAGVQLEFPTDGEVLAALDKLLVSEPDAQLLVLSEYTFDGTVPEKIMSWCRNHQRYLIVGGKDPGPKSNFYDTAFVLGPDGSVVFRQGKSVPIQFFKDGLPALEQKLWDSPWGKIGICICYDLSYRRVTDRLIRMGAQAIVVPTMDVVDWGRHEHELHARVAPLRAVEYGVPIFRVASSGISQCVDRTGRVEAKADFPGQGEMLSGRLVLGDPGSVPLDRWLAPFCSAVTGLVIIWFCVRGRSDKTRTAPFS